MPSASGDGDRRAADEDQRVGQRLPEHVVVEQHLLVVLEPDPLAGFSGDQVLERKPDVPAERQDAVEEEDRQRRQQEAGHQRQLARALAAEPGHARSLRHPGGGSLARRRRDFAPVAPRQGRWHHARRSSRRRALGVGQRRLGVLAAEHRALELRPERLLDAAVVAEPPVAAHLVGVLELGLQHRVGERIVLLEARELRLVDRLVAGQQLAVARELVGHLVVGEVLHEVPGELGVLRALGDAEAVRVGRRPVARHLRDAQRLGR